MCLTGASERVSCAGEGIMVPYAALRANTLCADALRSNTLCANTLIANTLCAGKSYRGRTSRR